MFKCNVSVSMYRQEKAEEHRNKTNRKRQLWTLKNQTPLRELRQGGLSAWRPKLACVQIWLLIKTIDFLKGQVSWFDNVEM